MSNRSEPSTSSNRCLDRREEINEHRAQAGVVEAGGGRSVATAATAAPRAVGEDHDTRGVVGQGDVGVDLNAGGGHRDECSSIGGWLLPLIPADERTAGRVPTLEGGTHLPGLGPTAETERLGRRPRGG